LASYLGAIRAHAIVVVLITLAAIAASVAFLQLRSSQYEATTEILVEPLPLGDQMFTGLPLVRDTGDPARTVQTAAALVDAQIATDRIQQEVGANAQVEVNPVGESNILGITVTADGAQQASDMANAVARTALEARDQEVGQLAGQLADQLEAQLDATASADQETRTVLATRLDQVRSVQETGDPTLTLAQPAPPPSAAVGASPALVVVLAILVGFTIASGAAILLELLARRIRDVDEAMQIYPLPILVRVPKVAARKLRGPAGPTWSPPEIREPFRTLALQLEERGAGQGIVMVTSATSGDGKTLTAINLAGSLAAGGRQVALLDFDLRHPRIGTLLGVGQHHPLGALANPRVDLGSLLVSIEAGDSASQPRSRSGDGDGLLKVLALRSGADLDGWIEVVGQRIPDLIAQARAIADWVVVDTAPLGAVGDALRVASHVDEIVLVTRPGNTVRTELETTRDLLVRMGGPPTGYVVVGDAERPVGDYYSYGVRHQRGAASAAARPLVRGRPRADRE